MKKTIVLSYPNLRWLKYDGVTTWNLNPSTLCLLGAIIRDEITVKIVDAQFYNLTLEQYVEKVLAYNPSYVGISVLSSEYASTLHKAAEVLKQHRPDLTIIAGGVHVTRDYLNVIADKNIDYAIRGEGEFVLKKLIRHLICNDDIPTEGLVYKKGKKIIVQSHSIVKDLRDLPLPDYDLVDMHEYAQSAYIYRPGPSNPPIMPGVRICVTRGCPIDCSFCQVSQISGRKTRTRSPEQIVEELSLLKNKYHIKSVIFDDDNIVGNKKFFKELMRQIIKTSLGLKFVIGAFAIFSLDDDMLNLMTKAGCIGVNLAIESGSQRVLDEIVMKPIKLVKVPSWITKIKDKGIFVICNFIIGFPNETWDEILETIHFAESCGAEYVKFFIAAPLEGTRLWNNAQESGKLITGNPKQENSRDWSHFSGHGTAKILSDEWSYKDLQILRAFEWDRINFGKKDRKHRAAEIYGINEKKLDEIRKTTRNSITKHFVLNS